MAGSSSGSFFEPKDRNRPPISARHRRGARICEATCTWRLLRFGLPCSLPTPNSQQGQGQVHPRHSPHTNPVSTSTQDFVNLLLATAPMQGSLFYGGKPMAQKVEEKWCCLLCRRAFKEQTVLNAHIQKPEPHQTNPVKAEKDGGGVSSGPCLEPRREDGSLRFF
jgi:hypothetical protein